MILKDSGVKRLAVYVMHDDDGIVDKYIDVFLAGLRSETACLRVVINGNVEAEGEARIREIADEVQAGETIGTVDTGTEGIPVRTQISGILRGIIRDGYPVSKGFKLADVDPRLEEKQNCFTISDKARCIAGSVLELACGYFRRQG